jgi:hypothetical protein
MERPLARRDIDVELGKASEGRRTLRIAFLRRARRLWYRGEPLHSALSSLFLGRWCMGMASRGLLASQPRVESILRVELRELRYVDFSSN